MESNESSSLGKLTEESLKRKERLRLLREKATKKETDPNSGVNAAQSLPKPVFRNYKPQNEETEGELLPQQITGDIEATVQTQLESVMASGTVEEIDLTNLAPRKPDWDLKRDVAKKLEKLERRTQRAIAELIRVRLKGAENPSQEWEKVVNVGTAASTIAPSTIIHPEDDEY